MTTSWTVLLTGSAKWQVEAIDAWWRVERAHAPDLFAAELDRVVDRLSRVPGSGAPFVSTVGAGLRRVLLPRSCYHVYYTVEAGRREVIVRAVWHAARGQGPELH